MEENQYYLDNANGGSGNMVPGQPVQGGKGSGKGLFLAGLIIGMASTLMIVGVWYLSALVQRGVEKRREASAVVETDDSIIADGRVIDEETVKKLQLLEETIDKYYYLDTVSDEMLRDGMYEGLFAALGDPYSEYYTEEELNDIMEQASGAYYGIGAYVNLDTVASRPRISGVIAGTPAEEAGLRSDDLIYEINGTSTYGLSLTQAVSLIKGPEGTEVELVLIREGEQDYVTVKMTRRLVETPTVSITMLEDNMAYIVVAEYNDVSVNQFATALDMAYKSDAKGIILDLRGNPGGNVDSVVKMCQMILPKGLIVYTEDKDGKREEFTCDGKNELKLPLVVLIDVNTASAAEIMAGAIKDYGIGKLVGTTTYGKGIVQMIMPLMDGSAIKLTTSAYYTPKGYNIHGIGIEPDIVCEFDGDAYYGSADRPDNQLEKAKEVLKEMYR